jgi:hypothetical protein
MVNGIRKKVKFFLGFPLMSLFFGNFIPVGMCNVVLRKAVTLPIYCYQEKRAKNIINSNN